MEVLNATGLSLVSAHKPSHSADKIGVTRKLFSLPLPSFPKLPIAPALSGGLVLATNLVGNGVARALTYEEALQQSVEASSSFAPPEIDVGGLVDSLVSYGLDNPPVIAGGIAALAIPFVLSQVLKQGKAYGVASASNAYARLSGDASAQLVDIRGRQDFREGGSPDIRKLKKKPVSIVYQGGDKPGFLKKLASRFKEPEKTTLYILDKFDGNSELVAELVTLNGFKEAYAIKDGAEGPRGWKKSGLPWIAPKKSLSFDLGELKDALSAALEDGSDGSSLALGAAAAAGLGALVFTEAETVLQLLGSAALVQFVTKKLLFAEDRKKTLQEFDEFFTTKVAPGDLLDEIKVIGKALLPTINGKALPAATEAAAAVAVEEKTVAAPAATTTQINSIPNVKVKEESISGLKRPLSPYPYYPDFKPPSSPSPSQP